MSPSPRIIAQQHIVSETTTSTSQHHYQDNILFPLCYRHRRNEHIIIKMKVFVTGATGYIGSVLVPELINAGHSVLGLARSDAGAAKLVAAGAEVHRGSLEDLESLKTGAATSDGVIHAGFPHDFSDYEGCCKKDFNAIDTMGNVLAGTDKPLVITSGTLVCKLGELATEDVKQVVDNPLKMRLASEEKALEFANKGVRVSVIRLPPTVHSEGDKGFTPAIITAARTKGVSAYIGDGSNRWPSVHRFDAASLFRLALEKAPAGSIYHGVADEGVPLREMAEVIGRHLNVPVASKSAEEAGQHFGWVVMVVGLDNPTSSALTQKQLGWKPAQPGLLQDLEQGHYFKEVVNLKMSK